MPELLAMTSSQPSNSGKICSPCVLIMLKGVYWESVELLRTEAIEKSRMWTCKVLRMSYRFDIPGKTNFQHSSFIALTFQEHLYFAIRVFQNTGCHHPIGDYGPAAFVKIPSSQGFLSPRFILAAIVPRTNIQLSPQPFVSSFVSDWSKTLWWNYINLLDHSGLSWNSQFTFDCNKLRHGELSPI